MNLKKAPAKLQLQVRQISANKGYSVLLKFDHIFKLRALDSPYTRMYTLFELTWLFLD